MSKTVPDEILSSSPEGSDQDDATWDLFSCNRKRRRKRHSSSTLPVSTGRPNVSDSDDSDCDRGTEPGPSSRVRNMTSGTRMRGSRTRSQIRRSCRTFPDSMRCHIASENVDSDHDTNTESSSSSGVSRTTSGSLMQGGRKHLRKRRSCTKLPVSTRYMTESDESGHDRDVEPGSSSGTESDPIRATSSEVRELAPSTSMERSVEQCGRRYQCGSPPCLPNDSTQSDSSNDDDKEQGPLSSPVIKTVSDIIKNGNAFHALGIFKVPVVIMEKLQDVPDCARRRKSFVCAEAKMSVLGTSGLDFVWDSSNPSSKVGSLKTSDRCRGKKTVRFSEITSDKRHSTPLPGYRGIETVHQSPKELVCEEDLIANADVSLHDVDRQSYKVYDFSIYDKDGQPCYFESRLLQKKTVFLKGNVKAIYDDGGYSEGIACGSIGPVTSWWLTGFNSGDNVVIGMSTDCADYYLVDPEPAYRIFMAQMMRQIALTKIVLETVSNNLDCSYEALVDAVASHKPSNGEKPYVENELLQHARFILGHACSYDSARASWEKVSVSSAPCMQKLVNLCRIKLRNGQSNSELQSYIRPGPSPATCTPIVHEVFDMMFSPEMHQNLLDSPKEMDNNKELCPDNVSVGTDDSVNLSVWARGERIMHGDYVLIEHFESSRVGRVVRFFTESSVLMAHLQWFCFPKETVLGEIGNPHELFMIPDCGDVKVEKILQKMKVLRHDITKTWNSNADTLPFEKDNVNGYFYSKLYNRDENRFEDAPDTISSEADGDLCYNCNLKREQEMDEMVKLYKAAHSADTYAAVRWHRETYRPGDFILLEPGTFGFAKDQHGIKRSGAQPCHIAVIKRIFKDLKSNSRSANNVMLQVSKYYRPEDTALGSASLHMNVIFASEELSTVHLSAVVRKTNVEYVASPPTSAIWDLHNKFFCSQSYCAETRTFTDLTCLEARQNEDGDKEYPAVRRLRTLDVFAGCGGLSLGFEMAGVSETRWALEHCDAAARAFQLNFPDATVFIEDCNSFLKDILEGKETGSKGKRLPQRGDVELLCGGPPCQGFSLLNRFRDGRSARFKNSLVASYLSLCDIFRPRYFVLENVRNFAYVEQHLVLQLTIKCLLRMGYQCAFNILQARSFCLPQDRKRFFIIAAAPGEILPKFPKPWSCSRDRSSHLKVCGQKYELNTSLKYAPLRAVTIRDAIKDLASVDTRGDVAAAPEPVSQFQQIMSGDNQGLLKDHHAKKLNPLIEARLQHIPKHPGANWQHLPDIAVPLSNGSMTEKLAYHDFGNGVKALCCCAVGSPCLKSMYFQKNTLRPWNLTHKLERAKAVEMRGDDSRAYSRLDWDGHAITLTTTGVGSTHGCIHPDQDRFLTPRERARVQGFPDKTAFVGSITDKNKQIGNAVPPPLAAAVGYEIVKSLAASQEERTGCCFSH
ncbi:DNA (cytosine-5)-methyltransferase 1-like [Ornithodoros turicata]|uniref:DNA (cytosine-5)-methyltransferase 1-like n=1 Tax=Ornithodoros turicata TaxID=34597 RepID=UPI00313933CC